MFRFTTRDVPWLTVVLAIGLGWFYHSTVLWMGKAMAEDEMRLLAEEVSRLRAELASVQPDKIHP